MQTDDHQRRLHFLDSLRGIAALGVVFFHTLLLPMPNPTLNNVVIERFVRFSGTGVYLFFVISGFSLAMTVNRHAKTGTPNLSYLVSRYFRIGPLFYTVLAISVLREIVVYHNPPSPKIVLLNVAFLFNFFPGKQEGIVWASWTIGVEMIFYLIFILIHRIRFVLQVGLAVIAAAVFLAETMILPRSYYHWSFVGYLPMFLLGMWAYYAYVRLSVRPSLPKYLMPSIICGGLTLIIACAITAGAESSITLRFPIALGYALVVLGSGLAKPAFLSSKVLVFYGKISYSLYLLHALVIVSLGFLLRMLGRILPTGVIYWVDVSIVLTIVTPLAWAVFEIVERPGVKLGHRVFAVMRNWVPREREVDVQRA